MNPIISWKYRILDSVWDWVLDRMLDRISDRVWERVFELTNLARPPLSKTTFRERRGELNMNIAGPGGSRFREALFAPHLGSFAARAGEAAAGTSAESLAEVFDAAGTTNVDKTLSRARSRSDTRSSKHIDTI
mgnify:CR=1 FL=1